MFHFCSNHLIAEDTWLEELRAKRRLAWIKELDLRICDASVAVDNAVICSIHFQNGRPSHTSETHSYDWTPTLCRRSPDKCIFLKSVDFEEVVEKLQRNAAIKSTKPQQQKVLTIENPRNNKQMLSPAAIPSQPSTNSNYMLLAGPHPLLSTTTLIKSNSQLNICVKNSNGTAKPLKLTGHIFQVNPPKLMTSAATSLTSSINPPSFLADVRDVTNYQQQPPQSIGKNPSIIFMDVSQKCMNKIKTEPIDDDYVDQIMADEPPSINSSGLSAMTTEQPTWIKSENHNQCQWIKVEATTLLEEDEATY